MLAMKPMAAAPPVEVSFVEAPDVAVLPVWDLMFPMWDLMSMPAFSPVPPPLSRHAARRQSGAEKHHHGDGGGDPENP
jgi:hypothetical protein